MGMAWTLTVRTLRLRPLLFHLPRQCCTPSRPPLTASLFSAPGRVPHSPAPPVHRLARLPGHTPLQALSAQGGPAAGEVAGAVRRAGGTHCGPLPVSMMGRGLQGIFEDATGHKYYPQHPGPYHILAGQWECTQGITILLWTGGAAIKLSVGHPSHKHSLCFSEFKMVWGEVIRGPHSLKRKLNQDLPHCRSISGAGGVINNILPQD